MNISLWRFFGQSTYTHAPAFFFTSRLASTWPARVDVALFGVLGLGARFQQKVNVTLATRWTIFFVMDRCSLPSFELSPADSVGPRWERWLARFENYLMASKIAGDDRQKAQYYCMSQEATYSISTQRWQCGLTRPMLRRPPSRPQIWESSKLIDKLAIVRNLLCAQQVQEAGMTTWIDFRTKTGQEDNDQELQEALCSAQIHEVSLEAEERSDCTHRRITKFMLCSSTSP